MCLHGGKNDDKCEPGPELKREMQRKATEKAKKDYEIYRKTTVQQSNAESARALQQLEQRSRAQGAQSSSAPAVAPSPPGASRIRTGLPGVPGMVLTGPKPAPQPAPTHPTAAAPPPPEHPPVVATQHPAVAPTQHPPPATAKLPEKNPTAASVPGISPFNAQGNGASNSGSSFNIPTPCQDLTGRFGCRDGGRVELRQARLPQGGPNQTVSRPGWRGFVAPDVQAEILALADQLIDKASSDKADNDPATDELVRRLKQRLAAHRVPVKRQDLSCLQPIHGTSPRLKDIALRWKPEHIKKEAIDGSGLCAGVPEGKAKDDCREEKYGQAVMWAEPELAGQCRTAEMPTQALDAVAECAKKRFLAAWAKAWANHEQSAMVEPPTPDSWTMPGSCSGATPAARKQGLRDILRKRLLQIDPTPDAGNGGAPNGPQTAAAPAADDTPPPAPPADDNEAYCNYMARATVRGELTPSEATALSPECKATLAAAEALKAQRKAAGDMPFTMDAAETDREIAKLLPPPPKPKAEGERDAQPDGNVTPK